MRILLLMLVWLGGVAWAKPYQVLLSSRPPGAAVHQNGTFVGHADGLPVSVRFPDGEKSIQLSFSLPGYEPQMLSLDEDRAQEAQSRPLDTPVVLRPTSFWVALRDWPYLKLVGALLGLAGVGAAAYGGHVLKLRREARVVQEEAQAVLELQADGKDPLIGTVLGSYRILRKLGAGGMGQVYLATGPDQQQVALKLLNEEPVPEDLDAGQRETLRQQQEERRLRQRREVQILNSLRHPNIAALLDYGQGAPYDYLALELVPGTTLRHQLREEGLSPAEAWRLLGPLMDALAAAHDRHIVHRDLKPENVMVTPDGRVKVLDFGLGRDRNSATVTKSHDVMGTPEYMAPEQVQSFKAAPSMDQYAIGIMAYEMLSGRRPFEGDGALQLMMARLTSEAKPLGQVCSVSPALERVVMKMIATDPAERFTDLREAARAFQEAM